MKRYRSNNQKSAKTSNEFVYAAASSIHNKGLFARKEIPAGTDLAEYDGPRLGREEGEKLAEEGNSYVFGFDGKSFIDGSVKWNLARFANHSCEPNAKSVKVNGRIFLRSLRTIAKGEEITYNYGYDFKRHEDNPCNCGKAACVGYMVQEKYRTRLR